MKRTKKEILAALKTAREERERLINPMNDKAVARSQAAMNTARTAFYARVRPLVDDADAFIAKLENEMSDRSVTVEPPAVIAAFIKELWRGADWGSKLEVVWWSEDYRYCIIRWKGHSCWQGVGHRGYHPTHHWLVDTTGKQAVGAGLVRGQMSEHVGRFPAAVKKDWIASVTR